MALNDPVVELDADYSSQEADPTPWPQARQRLEDAEVYWLSTVRPDGRPHVTPLIAVWVDDALHFCTGPGERKAKNLAANPHCILTTGNNAIGEGLDVVVEEDAIRVSNDGKLQNLAKAYESKYGSDWHFDVRDGVFVHEAGTALVYEVGPATVFGFAKGAYGQTRFRFARD